MHKGSNELTFTNLQHGDYQLLVITSKAISTSSQYQILEIKINTPIWKTYWAYIIYGIIIISLIYIFRSKNVANQKLKTALKIKQLESEKIK